MSLWDVKQGIDSLNAKPRAACWDEVACYLKEIASNRGIYIPVDASFGPDGITSGGKLLMAMPAMPAGPVATLDYLDEAGEVIRTVALPADKSGKIPMDAKQVRAVAQLQTIRKAKAPQKAAQSVPDAAPTSAPSIDVSALLERVAALEAAIATMGRPASVTIAAPANDIAEPAPRRTAAQSRAIQRAWDMRCAMRARADLDSRALIAANADRAQVYAMLEEQRTAHAKAAADLHIARRALVEDGETIARLKSDNATLSARMADAGHFHMIAEERALNAESRALRMVRAASGYRTSLHRARQDTRASRAEARALSRRIEEMRAPARPAAPPVNAMAMAFAEAAA